MKAVIYTKGEAADSPDNTDHYEVFESASEAKAKYDSLVGGEGVLTLALVEIERAIDEHWIGVEDIDLFEFPNQLPEGVKAIVDRFNEDYEGGEVDSYALCKELSKELFRWGYSMEYGLDGLPFDLRQINTYQ